MTQNRFIAALSLLSLIGSQIATADEISSPITIAVQPSEVVSDLRLKDLDAMVNKALETFKVPGAAVGILIDGKVVLTKGYGLRNQADRLPVTENTLFAIGSCTKAFTTHILGQLADEGKLSWDDPVIKHLPEFRLKDEYATHHITLRDLVTHQSGLPRHDFLWYHSDLSRNDLLSRLPHLNSSTDLRGKFQYNNLMYVMAGLVIEKITGETWEEAVQSRILTPLGMSRTNFSVLDSQNSDDFSLPFREKNGTVQSIPFYNITIAGPAGSINSSVADMVKWVGLQLSDGTFEGHKYLKKETLQGMHSTQVAFRTFPEESSYSYGYGLGWCTGTHEGHYYVSHDGGIDGFISSTGFLPKEKIGVVVLTNSDSGMMFANCLSKAIMDQILGIAKDDWMLTVKGKEEKLKKALLGAQDKKEPAIAAGPMAPLSDYLGEFENPGYGNIRVTTEGSNLIFTYNTVQVPFTHRCYDHFTGELEGIVNVTLDGSFIRNHFGEIAELQLPMEHAVEPISFKRRAGSELLTTEYLKQFEGVFESDLFTLTVGLKGNQLTATIPGSPDEFVMVPEKPLQFTLKGVPGTTIRFVSSAESTISELQFISSQGTITFKRS